MRRISSVSMPFRPAIAARLSYLALFAAIGAWFPYLGVFFQERGLDLGQIGLMTALGAAAGLVAGSTGTQVRARE